MFESDLDVIQHGADQRMAHIRSRVERLRQVLSMLHLRIKQERDEPK